MMPLFIVVLVVVILLLTLPLWRKQKTKITDNQMNVAIYKTQVEELQHDLDNGKIDKTQHEQSLNDLQTTLGQHLDSHAPSAKPQHNFLGFVLVAVLVTGVSLATYQQVKQTPSSPVAQQNKKTPTLEELVITLEGKLKDQPNNSEGWEILARTYESTERFEEAVVAYRNAQKYHEDGEDNPRLLVKLGYAVALVNKGDFTGESITLFRKAAKIDPKNQDSRYLIGRYHFDKGEYQNAITTWEALMPMLNPNDKTPVQDDIRVAQNKLGIAPKPEPKTATARTIVVNVSLSPDVKADPNTTVFVSAHAKQGPPMPLAAQKLKVSDLPITITLDESKAVIPNMTINSFDTLIVKARISQAGTALPSEGDIAVKADVIEFGQPISLIIK